MITPRVLKMVRVKDDAVIIDFDGTLVLLYKSTARGILQGRHYATVVLEFTDGGCRKKKDKIRVRNERLTAEGLL